MDLAAITGTGVVSTLGHDPDAYWQGLVDGIVTIKNTVVGGDPAVCAPIETEFGEDQLDAKVRAGTARFARMFLVAAEAAVRDAGLDHLDPFRTAVINGTSMGGLDVVLDAQEAYVTGGPDAIPPKVMIQMWPNMAAGQFASKWGLHGPQYTFCTACASSADAIGTGARLVDTGVVDVAVVGGSEASLRAMLLQAAGASGAGSAGQDPARASLPFDRNRSGMITGEGSGVLIIENVDHARARGASPTVEVRGYASLGDSYHPSSPDPTGQWQARTMALALADADRDASDVAAIYAHGTATRKGDTSEIRAINTVLGTGAPAVKVTSIKGHIGHTGGAAAVMSTVAAVRGLAAGQVVHTAGTTDVDPAAEFEVVTGAPATLDGDVLQVNAFGFGGQNASVVLGRLS